MWPTSHHWIVNIGSSTAITNFLILILLYVSIYDQLYMFANVNLSKTTNLYNIISLLNLLSWLNLNDDLPFLQKMAGFDRVNIARD